MIQTKGRVLALRTFASNHLRLILAYTLLALVIAVNLVPQFAFASTTITIDTDTMFASVNTWISTFIGPLSIGIGISIALALITFIGAQIIQAFRGAGRRS